MSTIGYENWAVDLANVEAIYPFQGLEVPMVIAGVVFWLWFHVKQARMETAHMEEAQRLAHPEKIAKAIERF
jgi:hypothetical protein